MQQRNDPYSTAPQDAHERERLSNVHPSGWRNPQPANPYNLVVVGAGTAGLVAAHAAAALGAKVALVERDLLGGDCLNVGCVPSKAIIRTSRLYAEMRHAEQYGAQIPTDIRIEFSAVMQRMRGIRARISRADSVSRLLAAGVDLFGPRWTPSGRTYARLVPRTVGVRESGAIQSVPVPISRFGAA